MNSKLSIQLNIQFYTFFKNCYNYLLCFQSPINLTKSKLKSYGETEIENNTCTKSITLNKAFLFVFAPKYIGTYQVYIERFSE